MHSLFCRRIDVNALTLEAWWSTNLLLNTVLLLLIRFSWRKCRPLKNVYYELLIICCLRQRDGLCAIEKWHARLDNPFSKDLLFFPIHSNKNHWYLQVVIIHHPLVSSSEQTASLFILDSLAYKADHKIHVDFILSYLRSYWPHLKDIGIHSSKVGF